MPKINRPLLKGLPRKKDLTFFLKKIATCVTKPTFLVSAGRN